MASNRKRRYDSQTALRARGQVDDGKARIPCERCRQPCQRKRLKLGYCPECWTGGGTVTVA